MLNATPITKLAKCRWFLVQRIVDSRPFFLLHVRSFLTRCDCNDIEIRNASVGLDKIAERYSQISTTSWTTPSLQNFTTLRPILNYFIRDVRLPYRRIATISEHRYFLSASLYVSKRGAYWDRLCRDVVGRWLVGRWLVGCHARALWRNGASYRPIVTMEH